MTILFSKASLDVALRIRDGYTQAHCARVEGMAHALGRRCGLDARHLLILRAVAELHDVGKIGIPDAVLLKPGRFDAAEWALMQCHSAYGAEICAQLPHDEAAEVARAVRHHHEYFDGGGYPDGLAGEAIPVCARIVSVVDSYDAMTTRRAYQPVRGHAEALGILRDERGGKHDPHVLGHFLAFAESPAFAPFRADPAPA